METVTKNLSVNEDKSIKASHVLNSSRQDVGSRLTAEERITRDAILDVIDDHEWRVYEREFAYHRDAESLANAARLDFADAVIARARRIKQVDDAIEDEENRAEIERRYQEKQL